MDSSSEKPPTEARLLITAARSATASTWFTLRRGGARASPSSHLTSSSGAFVLGCGLSSRFGCRVRVVKHEDDFKTHSCDVT